MRTPLIVLTFLSCLALTAPAVADDDGASPFSEGSWTAQVYGGAALADRKGDQFDLHAGAGYFFADGWSFNVEGLAGYVDPRDDEEGVVGGFDLLVRWHFLRDRQEGKWSIYVASGLGVQEADTNFPSDSHHNFRLNVVDLGGTLNLFRNVSLMGGARYLHISNAHTTEGNDGLDGVMPYAGVMVGF